jgi:casein kinase II subunit beta
MYLVFPGLLPAKVRASFPTCSFSVILRVPPSHSQAVPEHGPSLIAPDGSRRARRDRQPEESAVGAVGEEGQSTVTAALNAERYRPRIYGFQVHEVARWQRWQEAMRDR